MRPVRHVRRRLLSIAGSLLIVAGLLPVAATIAVSTTIVISEFRTRGPAGGNDEFVELRNVAAAAVDISGWLLQGCSSGTPGTASTRATVVAGVVLGPGQSYLFGNSNTGGYSGTVTPNQTYSTGFTDFADANFAGIRIVNSGSAVVDGVGSSGSPCREGTGFVTPSTNTDNSFERIGGTQDTDNNVADFAGPKAGNPQNFDAAPAVTSTSPANSATGVAVDSNITVTFNEPVDVAGAWYSISCGTSGAHTADVTGGATGYTLNPDADFANSETCTVTIDDASVADQDANDPPNTMAADYVFSFTTVEAAPGDAAPTVSSTTPSDGATGVPVTSNITVTFSEPVTLGGFGDMWVIHCPTSPFHAATRSGGPTTFTLDPTADLPSGETCSLSINGGGVQDVDTNDPPDFMLDYSFSFTTQGPPPRIHDIQGSSHTAAILGPVSSVSGIVTAKRSNGFYMQDPVAFWDANDATSEAIFVFTSSAPTAVTVGDAVMVSGNVVEFRPGGASSTNLTITEISGPQFAVLSSGNPLPPVTVIGTGGRVPPTSVIDDDASGSVETSGVFDPATDGIDFYESLEAMRVQVNAPVAVGPRNRFGEIFVLGDDGASASARTTRGGIVIRPTDFNPERIQLDDALLVGSTPNASVGDHFSGPAVGILDYDFGNFEVNLTSALTTVPGGLAREVTASPAANELSVATFNVENLDAAEPQSKFDALAAQIITNLRAPDVIALEEIQDNNGATNDAVVDASDTLTKLINSIVAAGGPTYQFRQINPVDDQDGGEPGGNIRVGFLFRTDRGLAFVDRAGGGSTTATTIDNVGGNPQLSSSPGRVSPASSAWNASRKSLAGEFTFRGQTIFIIANHFNSKSGDQPLFGRFQPPARSSEVQRHQQAQLLNDFVDAILAVDANANVVVIGDINDFEFSQTVTILKGGVLHDLMDTLPQSERYSYVFEGNSQTLDHILVSNNLFTAPGLAFDAVHINAEFHDQLSDHDPSVMRFAVVDAPTPTPTPSTSPSASPSSSPSSSPSASPTSSATPIPTLPPTDASDSGTTSPDSLWIVLLGLLALIAAVATPTRAYRLRRS